MLVFGVGVQLPEPLTGKLWTLDDFEGNSALLVSEFLFPVQMSLNLQIYAQFYCSLLSALAVHILNPV